MEYSQQDNLLIQTYFTTSFIGELNNLNFLNSEYYKNAQFEDKFVKDNLPKIGIDNQGTLLIFLYTMLVIPRQLLEEKYPEGFQNLNLIIDQIKSEAQSDYSSDSDKINYIRHIRNSIAHARVEFEPEKTVTFIDQNRSGNTCRIIIPLNKVGLFLTELQKLFLNYVEDLKTKSDK